MVNSMHIAFCEVSCIIDWYDGTERTLSLPPNCTLANILHSLHIVLSSVKHCSHVASTSVSYAGGSGLKYWSENSLDQCFA
jgi:hypothetical protein